MSAAAGISGVQRRVPCERCESRVEQIDALHVERTNLLRERDAAYETLRRYDEETARESRFDALTAAFALVGAATVIVALVCLAVLALRLAGGVQ